MEKDYLTTRELVMLAVYAALFLALELVQNQFGFFKMANGGSWSISVVVLLLASYHLGYKKGVYISLISVVLQFLSGDMYLATGVFGFILDYVIAYGVYGLASIFPNFKFVYTGVFVTNLVRFLVSTLSGMIFYKVDLLGSLAYNATYMLPTTITALVLVPILHHRMKKLNLM
ncbi:MAG TPA: energy-coupled thiamine transporter ThiT [Erysipelotrichaceae bacterium]|nr:energy-coupled thiamine transporter ThiT [Erysipelotrichaceae bacterium]